METLPYKYTDWLDTKKIQLFTHFLSLFLNPAYGRLLNISKCADNAPISLHSTTELYHRTPLPHCNVAVHSTTVLILATNS